MASFVVGSDKLLLDLTEETKDQFFSDCTRFFAERYGRKNIITAVVRLDETTAETFIGKNYSAAPVAFVKNNREGLRKQTRPI